MTQGKSSSGATGNYTPQQALAKLLAGTGLIYRIGNGNTLTLQQQPSNFRKTTTTPDNPEPQSSSGEGQVMPKVTVEANAEYDAEYYTDPYNKDYVIPNATAGTKTDTPIMETPLNVQVISKQLLKERQVFRLADALKNVSGVTTNSINATADQKNATASTFGGSEQTLFLRGFESQTFFRNGFRLTEGSASKGFANVESVEVLKGPAAILYGLVEPGGMVNVITKQPLATPYYGFTQQVGSFDTYRTTLDVTGPIAGNTDLLYRVNLSYENSGSFRQFLGKEDVFFAPVLTWNISPKTQITFEMEYDRIHQGLDNGFIPKISNLKLQPFNANRNYAPYSPGIDETIFGGFRWSHQLNDDWILKHNFAVNQRSTDNFQIAPFASGTKRQIEASLGEDTFLETLPDQNYIVQQTASQRAQNNTYSTNLDLVGHFDTFWFKHTLLMGGDYYRLDYTRQNKLTASAVNGGWEYIPLSNLNRAYTPPGYELVLNGGPSTGYTDQYGLYIQDQIKLPYDLHVTGGIRWQYIHSRNVSRNVDNSVSSTSGSTQDAVTPRVGILWNPEKWISLYANYSESFGVNDGLVFVRDRVGKVIEPTSAEQYEGGIKFSFFDNKLRGTFAYYDHAKTNVAVGDPDITHNCGTGGFISGQGSDCSIALGKVRSRDPEFDITGEVLPGWNLIATWANTDIKVIETNAKGDSFGFGLFPGARLPGVSRNTGSFWSTYEIQDGDFKGLQFGGGVNLTGKQLGSYFYSEGKNPVVTPGYVTLDMMAGYSKKIGDATISAQLNISNLLDKKYYTSIQDLDSFQTRWVSYGSPRTFMGQISIQY
ncbi:MAG: TonB-dependent receptor [Methylococcaceae bacterium]|nr:TonB-dependent receptor [Methylococcaceae bacterium]